MKKSLKIILALFILPLSLLPNFAHASTQDFYFEDATFDYYLEPTDTGSKMRVHEVLTAIFPDTDQDHGSRASPRRRRVAP